MDEHRILQIVANDALSQRFVDASAPYNLECIFLLAEPYYRSHPYQNEALNLCRRYIEPGAERELNISPGAKQAVMNYVHGLTEDAVADPNAFRQCFLEQLELLQANIAQGNCPELEI